MILRWLWMKQIAENLTDCVDGFLTGKRSLLLDRDSRYCAAFNDMLENEGMHTLPLPPKSRNLHACLERYSAQ